MSNILNAGDRLWERLQQRFPFLMQLDDKPWKSWITHSCVAIVAGLLLWWAALGIVPLRWCWRFFVALYLVREILNVQEVKRDGRRPNYLDHVGDVLVPLIITETIGVLL